VVEFKLRFYHGGETHFLRKLYPALEHAQKNQIEIYKPDDNTEPPKGGAGALTAEGRAFSDPLRPDLLYVEIDDPQHAHSTAVA
jgi:hypothetical protein